MLSLSSEVNAARVTILLMSRLASVVRSVLILLQPVSVILVA